jgi:hypothetical protein
MPGSARIQIGAAFKQEVPPCVIHRRFFDSTATASFVIYTGFTL